MKILIICLKNIIYYSSCRFQSKRIYFRTKNAQFSSRQFNSFYTVKICYFYEKIYKSPTPIFHIKNYTTFLPNKQVPKYCQRTKILSYFTYFLYYFSAVGKYWFFRHFAQKFLKKNKNSVKKTQKRLSEESRFHYFRLIFNTSCSLSYSRNFLVNYILTLTEFPLNMPLVCHIFHTGFPSKT